MRTNRIVLAVGAAALALAGCKKAEKQAEHGATGSSGAAASSASGQGSQAPGSAQAPKNPEGCNSDLTQKIEASTTFTEKCSPYTITGELSVDGWDLTIEPGVEIRMAQGANLAVGWGSTARLIARGTAEKPIKFVAAGRSEPGSWRRIAFHGNAGKSELEYVQIQYAGTDDEAAILVDAPDVSLSHVTVKDAKKVALEAPDNAHHRLSRFADNDFSQATSSEVVMQLNAASLNALASSKFPPKSVIEVKGAVAEDTRVQDPGVPLRTHGELEVEGAEDGKSATLTLDPGVTWQFGDDGAVSVGWNRPGQLKAVGTAEKPIVFTHYGEQRPGAWKGLAFWANARPPQLSYVRVEWAGLKDEGAIQYRDGKGLGTLTHVTVTHSAGHGLKLEGTKPTPFDAFTDNVFQELEGAAVSGPATLLSKLGTGNDYGKDGRLDVENADVDAPTEWTAQPAPYVIRGNLTVDGRDDLKPASLTIAPGTTVKFMPDTQLQVAWNHGATLTAKGTPEKKIVFTAMSDPWKGLHFGTKGKVGLENVVIENVADDDFAVNADNTASGTAKIEVKGVKKAARSCATKLQVDVKGGGETEQDC